MKTHGTQQTSVSFVETLVLTEPQRRLLKKPLGELVKGTPAECSRKLKEAAEKERPPRLILVGDSVSRNAIQIGIEPDVIVIDNMEKRERVQEFRYRAEDVFRVENAAGTINSRAWEVVEEAVRRGNSVISVEGEEDLLTLVAILSSPEKSIVAYGQPDEGIVLVSVSSEKKAEVRNIVAQMDRMT